MLTLYSFGPAANSMKPLLTLFEKGLEFTPRFIDPTRFEHHEDWYKAINPRGQVPALDHDGHIITESTVICEYLEDAFPDHEVKLRPADPVTIAAMRVWTKWIDEYFCWCMSTIGWERRIGPIARTLSDAAFEEQMTRIPIPEQQVKWRTARAGFPAHVLAEEMRKIEASVDRLEARLSQHRWLAGDSYTLADVCTFAIAHEMQTGFAELVNPDRTPGLVDWLNRIHDRPAVDAMFARSRSEMPPRAPRGATERIAS